jgi:hypothetical protein
MLAKNEDKYPFPAQNMAVFSVSYTIFGRQNFKELITLMLGKLNLLELKQDSHEGEKSTHKPSRIICNT